MTIILDMTSDRYHDGSHFGIHALCDFDTRGPRFFYHRHVARADEAEATHAFSVGTAAHDLVLEGEQAYEERVAIRPETYPREVQLKQAKVKELGITAESELPEGWRREVHSRGFRILKTEDAAWTGAADYCQEWDARMRTGGREPISKQDDSCVRAIDHSLRNNPNTMQYLKRGMANLVVRTNHCGLPVQCQCDWLHSEGNPADPMTWDASTDAICDLKTCDSLNGFVRDIFKYRYDRQAAFYQHLLFEETGIQLPFVFLAAEKAFPHRCGAFECSYHAMARAFEINSDTLERASACYRDSKWPLGNPDGLQVVDLPRHLQEKAYA